MRNFLFTLPVFFINSWVFAQPAFGPAYLQNEIASVYITIDPDSMEAVLNSSNWYNEREFPAEFRYESTSLNQSFPQVGFRLRGNTSLNSAKKSFKISFNTYTTSGNWQGLEKMNLNGSANDPSMIRSKLCWDALRESDLPASRTSFVNFYINTEFKGLYSNVEHIDEVFTSNYFDGLGTGNLYKCLYPATLEYLGNDQDAYKLEANNRRSYELKTNYWTDDYSDLAQFIAILNQTPFVDLPCKLESVFNVDHYLRYAAIDVLTGNWDGYAYNQNNFYLYHNQKTGLFEFIPYDLDNTLGVDWVGQDWTTRNIYSWAPSNSQRPLFKRLLQVPEYRSRYSYYIKNYLETSLLPVHVNELALNWLGLLEQSAALDTYRTQDFGFTLDDFLESVDSAWGGQVKFGIGSYITKRKATALTQVDQELEPVTIVDGFIQNDFPFSTSGVVYARANGSQITTVRWEISTNGIDFTDRGILADDGVSPDLVASDGVYSATLPVLPIVDSIFYRFRANSSLPDVVWPCAGRKLFLAESQLPLFINEVMSKNGSTITDEDGEFEDWIELYNEGTTPVSLERMFLSNDQAIPMKWPLPDTTLAAGDFLLIWSDSDEEDGRLHTNFKLSASGEELRLYATIKTVPRLIDRVLIPALNEDISYGRQQDGSETWVNFSNATPNASNGSIIGIHSPEFEQQSFYPNPASDFLRFNRTVSRLSVYDQTGRIVISEQNVSTVSIAILPAGIYAVSMDGHSGKVVVMTR